MADHRGTTKEILRLAIKRLGKPTNIDQLAKFEFYLVGWSSCISEILRPHIGYYCFLSSLNPLPLPRTMASTQVSKSNGASPACPRVDNIEWRNWVTRVTKAPPYFGTEILMI